MVIDMKSLLTLIYKQKASHAHSPLKGLAVSKIPWWFGLFFSRATIPSKLWWRAHNYSCCSWLLLYCAAKLSLNYAEKKTVVPLNIQHFETWNLLTFFLLWVILALPDPDTANKNQCGYRHNTVWKRSPMGKYTARLSKMSSVRCWTLRESRTRAVMLKRSSRLRGSFSSSPACRTHRSTTASSIVADPGCSSRILIFTHPGFQIPDLGYKNKAKEEGGGLEIRIRDPEITYPGSRIQKRTGPWIRIRNTGFKYECY